MNQILKFASHQFQGLAGRPNVEWEKMKKQTYDLEKRLLEYSVRIIKIVDQTPNTRAGNHLVGAIVKNGNFSLSKPW